MLFFNRSEPFLLLIVSTSLLLGNNFVDKKYLPILMGVLGGIASALKMHGVAYIVTAYLAVVITSRISISSLLLFLISSIISFLACFIPQNVSFIAFWGYLRLASAHGLSLKLWLENLIYFIFLLVPLFVFCREVKKESSIRINLVLILGVEFCVTIVAAKPGAGFYHLIPFIPINVFIMQRIFKKYLLDSGLIKLLYVSLIVVSLVTVFLDFVLSMGKSWRPFNEAKKEVAYFEKKYPGLLMGLTDDQGYPYTFLRVMLKDEQIDYAAYMDLQVAGVKDDTLVQNFNKCRIRSVLLPSAGRPFSLNNYYNYKPLFSEDVRKTFTAKYTCAESGKHYSAYVCSVSSKDKQP